MKPRGTLIGRVLGALLEWILIGGGCALFYRAASDATQVGSCASGGPYVIAQPCPSTIWTFGPIGVVAVILSLVVSGILALGFAPSAFAWGLPLLLGGGYLAGAITVAFHPDAWPALLFGLPLAIATVALIRTRVRARGVASYLLGDATVAGHPFVWADKSIGFGDLEPVAPRPGDWTLSIVTALVGVAVGLGIALPFALS